MGIRIVRERERPWGHADLKPWGSELLERERERERDGNCHARFVLKCIKCIMEVGGYFSVENPTSSYLWSLPGFNRLAHRVGSYKVRFHQCEYGLCFPDAPSKRCRKDTTILANFPEIMNLHVLWHLCLWWPFGVPGKQAGRRPIVTLVRRGLGGEKCPCGFLPWVCAGCSTRPGRPLWGRDACQDTASTEVERELKSTGGLRLACGRRQSGGMVQPGVSRGGISEASRFFCGGQCVFEFAPRTCPLGSACYRSGDSASGGKKKKTPCVVQSQP